jgi:hypothetical protein
MAAERGLLDFTDVLAFTGFTDPLLLLLKGLKDLALFTFGLGALLTLFAEAEAAEVILIVSPGFIVYSRTTGILFIRNKI